MQIKFDSSINQSSLIKVIGVGGGGSNAVNYMFNQGIQGVDFMVCNTDLQALDASPVPIKIQLGTTLTQGLGAGSVPEIGKNSALEDMDKIDSILGNNTRMVFITAGMGGGTGTGGAPVIAARAKELGILTVAIVTIPFSFEGKKRMQQAVDGINELKKNVDTILIICNDKMRLLYGNLKLSEALSKADDVLNAAAKGIAEIITFAGGINVDLNDVRTVMTDSGVALMGTGTAEGENRALASVEMAMNSPLLNDNNIRGAKDILLYIRSGQEEITMDEITEITDYIQNEAGSTAQIIWGTGIDESLDKKIAITLIATGFESNPNIGIEVLEGKMNTQRIVHNLEKIESKNIPVVENIKQEIKIESTIIQETKTEVVPEIKTEFKQIHPEVLASCESVYSSSKEESKTTAITFDIPVDNFHSEDLTSKEPAQMSSVNDILEDKLEDEMFVFTRSESEIEQIQKPKEQIILPVEEKTEHISLDKTTERIQRLKDLSMKLRNPQYFADHEAVPAFKRKEISLQEVTPSDESHVSRYSLNDEATDSEKKNTELRLNNSFLHDNPD